MATEGGPKSHVESLGPNPQGAATIRPKLTIAASRADSVGDARGLPTTTRHVPSLGMDLAGKTCVVIPTLNERNNLEALVRGIDRAFAGLPYIVVIVDDGSLDGTAEVARSLRTCGYPIELVERTSKQGIGSAVRAGLVRGLLHEDVDRLVTMDADLSHDPSEISRLLTGAAYADLTQGSRYVTGGVTEGWARTRRWVSMVANALVRMLFRTEMLDHTSFFRCYSRPAAVAAIRAEKYTGYEWSFGSLLAVLSEGLQLAEVPITFRERRCGTSKLRTRAMARWLWSVLRTWAELRLGRDRPMRAIRYIAVGSTGILMSQGMLFLLHGVFGLWPLAALTGAIEVSILWNFELNDRWTFKDRRTGSNRRTRLAKYHAVCAGSVALNALMFSVLSLQLGINYLVANLIGILAGFAVNLRGSMSWAWLGR